MDYKQPAMAWTMEHYPVASLEHRVAFANSVDYLVGGASSGFGGPSLREHLCSWSLAGPDGKVGSIDVAGTAMTAIHSDGSLPRAGNWTFEDAVKHCAPLCFGPAVDYRLQLLQIQEREHCCHDDVTDLEELRKKFV